ncbi:dihydrofolate reductase [Herbidospora sp. NEAU-GS84]|uniref:Dihydrofolate reductase n=1 Tax=Herbidospora solisilvae TaxID=2696284 RepID=A0A7C9JGQ7_9ACTN|nr:dihydrofolate reductase family protein [Herbidospora solisilvae]NAS24363.1 dihydrofolate reductase [Herbidospora solisilvae]
MIHAGITISLDGFVSGPNWGPGRGLGDGGERLHYWVFGGPWSYESPSSGHDLHPVDAQVIAEMNQAGAAIVGRGMFDAAGQWGGENPFASPIFVLTNRVTDDLPTAFTYVTGAEEALRQARETAGDRPIGIGGGADVIRQYLRMGVVDRLSITIAPVVLGGGTALFDGTFQADLDLVDCRTSPLATHLTYDVRR